MRAVICKDELKDTVWYDPLIEENVCDMTTILIAGATAA